MKSNRNILYFLRNINRKHRLSLRKEHDDTEVWYMHISPLEMTGGIIALLLIIFIAILSLIAYTPILNLIPGYSGNKARAEMIENIIRVDSIERRLDELQVYYSNVALIMEGKTPSIRNLRQVGDTVRLSAIDAVVPSAEDSALRRQMEGDGVYGLRNSTSTRSSLLGTELMPPVKGVIAAGFNPKEGRFGVGIATATNQQILTIAEGTVIFSSWSPDDGHIIQVQHAGNLVSIYRHSTQSLIGVGTRVRGGEVIGSTGEGISGEGGKRLFEFELWQNGTPIDPETYIVF